MSKCPFKQCATAYSVPHKCLSKCLFKQRATALPIPVPVQAARHCLFNHHLCLRLLYRNMNMSVVNFEHVNFEHAECYRTTWNICEHLFTNTESSVTIKDKWWWMIDVFNPSRWDTCTESSSYRGEWCLIECWMNHINTGSRSLSSSFLRWEEA